MPTTSKISVAVIGATGYTGIELVRLLHLHPQVNLVALTSRQNEGTPYGHLIPAFAGVVDLKCESPDADTIAKKAQAAFL